MVTVAVLGIGNILLGDEGVGVRAIERLEREGAPRGVDIYDGGTAPFDMIGVFLDHDLVVVVDCVRSGRAPGTVYRLTPDALDPVAEAMRFAHGFGVPDTLRLARRLGSKTQVVILGVEPESIGWSTGLTPIVEAAMPRLLEAIRAEISRLPSLSPPTGRAA